MNPASLSVEFSEVFLVDLLDLVVLEETQNNAGCAEDLEGMFGELVDSEVDAVHFINLIDEE